METEEILFMKDAFTSLELQLGDLFKLLKEKQQAKPTESEKIDLLMTALAIAQGEMEEAFSSGFNNNFKYNYANINDLLKIARPVLSKNKIAVTQKILMLEDDGGEVLETQITHCSGQWTKSICKIKPARADIQAYGAYITYLKRYQLQALIGISAGSDDDDGESNMVEPRQEFAKGTAINHNQDNSNESFEVITKAEREEIEYEVQGYPDILKEILKTFKIELLSNLPRSRYRRVIEQVRKIKQQREGK